MRTASLLANALAATAFAACGLGPAPYRETYPDPCIIERDAAATPPRATIADVAWLQGDWVGEGLGGEVEETWGLPKAGAMLGMFRLVKDGAPVFYELVALAETAGSLELRVRHFDPAMRGWEEKDSPQVFPLLRIEPGTAWFEGLTLARDGDDAMRAWVRVHRRDGTTGDETFVYRRR